MEAGRAPSTTIEAYALALNERDIEALSDLVHPHVVGHEQTAEIVGFDAFRANIEGWLANYPDLQLSTEDLFDNQDRAAWRWTLRGTHEPTGRRVAISGIIVFRVERGRIAEYWGHYDRLRLLQQQGTRP